MLKGLSRWIFGSTEYPVLIIGNDASGKTALLYRLKLNEFVTTIPTIGFNVETIEYPQGWSWTMWDVGGCDKIQPLLRHYLKPETLVLFLHDCQDTWRPEFPEWFHRFLFDMMEAQSKYLWILPTKQDDLPDRERFVSGVKQMYECGLAPYERNIRYKVLEHKLSAKTGEGVQEVLAELQRTMALDFGKARRSPTKAAGAPQGNPASEEELRALIQKEGNEDDVDMLTFWASFLSAELPTWGHRSHLKAGYIVALESAVKGESIFTTADIFIAHLRRLKEAHPERFRNTEHRTMTIFWLVQLQLAIWNYKLDLELEAFPSWSAFHEVLLHNPSLMNTRLCNLYYTKDRLFSQEAKESWIVPDLQQFPVLKPSPMQDRTVIQEQEENSDRLLRFAYAITRHILSSGLRRGAVIQDALASLQATTIRLRAVDSTIPPYSETQTYFWIQIVHSALQSLENQGVLALSEKPCEAPGATELSFSNFTLFFNITPEAWKEYYSRKVWESVAARMEFVPPDIKPLPNVIRVSPDAQEKATM
ncbi:P-loop containing nucleoside triphosphate hydrolase protein [Aspergillus karnatakaensis]|uniref:P-loop containing nucleoside triphosphate hydrolase protein n=1 Tax=Aspergillus karnatakaensis TaxID=1810916 RepID=UPI003CCDF5F0